MRRRPLLLLLLAALSLGLLAGCGGDGKGEQADAGTDANQLLKDTFTGKKDIKSGKVDLNASFASGGQTFSAKLGGPFQSTGKGKVPDVDIDASLEGGGQSLQAGITTTADEGFVSYGGTEYKIDRAMYQAARAQYEEQAKQGASQSQSLTSLGLNPSQWITNARNAGEAKVGDTDTIKITGDVDVPKLLDNVNGALAKLRSLGGSTAAGLPDQLSEQDKQEAAKAVKDLSVEIYTGAEDKIMRRLVLALKLEAPNSSGAAQTADIKFDLQLLDVNEDQEIEAPENARPFSELASKLQGLGLGGLGGLGGSGSSGGASQQNLDKYSKCIEDAGGDNAKIRKCSDLLTTP